MLDIVDIAVGVAERLIELWDAMEYRYHTAKKKHQNKPNFWPPVLMPKSVPIEIVEQIPEKSFGSFSSKNWWARLDLNQGPSGYEPDALTN